jgi:hypothetical protein
MRRYAYYNRRVVLPNFEGVMVLELRINFYIKILSLQLLTLERIAMKFVIMIMKDHNV